MIDAYGEPDPGGVSEQGGIRAIVYVVTNANIVAPFLQVRCCVNSQGVFCRLLTNYEGSSEECSRKRCKLIPEFEVIAEKFYSWSEFCFDDFMAWTTSFNEWEVVLKRFKSKSQ